jgi:TetR/AcrR family transcriptional regulator, transcriptional repressor of bet genes
MPGFRAPAGRAETLVSREVPMPGRKASEETRRDQIIRAAYEVAARNGLDGLTVRKVAVKARLSTGLVLFHFTSRDQLVVALLEWLLATTTVLHIGPGISAMPVPLDRLVALLRQEMDRLSREPRRIRLFFDFWVIGGRHPVIGTMMRGELARYRRAFRPIAREVLEAEPERFSQVTADGLAGVAVSFIKGCAVQAMIDPEHFDIQEYLLAAEGLLGYLAPPAPAAAWVEGSRPQER